MTSGVNRRTFIGGSAGLVTGAVVATGVQQPAVASTASRRALMFRDDFGAVPGWERQGVVMRQDLPWESSLLQDPCLVYGSGGGPLFKLWYGSLHGVGYATSQDGRQWTKQTEPVLRPTLPTESNALNQPSVVYQGGRWHMTYFGVAADGNGAIHYASATNPGGPWTKGGVVLTSTLPWEDRWIYNSSLLYDAGARLWKMWYTAGMIASAGGEPEYVCYATATNPAGPWTKHPANPLIRPMQDGGWASLGIGGPNVRKLPDGTYETRIVGWQADYPSRGGRLTSPDGLTWQLNRSSMELDLGVVDGPEDGMIYRQFVVEHQGRKYMYYNVKNNRPGWNETINLAIWNDNLQTIDPAKWCMNQAWQVPTGASFTVRDRQAVSLGNAPADRPQTLQGNVRIDARDYTLAATVTPLSQAVGERDNVLLARYTDRDSYYYAGIASWNQKYAIGVMDNGVNTKLAGTGAATDIAVGQAHRLAFKLTGSRLDLYDNDQLVLSTNDPTLIPSTSYVGLQTTAGRAQARFAAVSVER
ncbi:hypothetical protein AB0P21_38780 [Kribbella sp. NPDC056861]|uniref:hypothetical protein n=1 Tax=Kribbella sp. NPDC056861 TaxID=3154857 RepID=UPI003413292C